MDVEFRTSKILTAAETSEIIECLRQNRRDYKAECQEKLGRAPDPEKLARFDQLAARVREVSMLGEYTPTSAKMVEP